MDMWRRCHTKMAALWTPSISNLFSVDGVWPCWCDITVHAGIKDIFLILHFYEFYEFLECSTIYLLSPQSHVTSHVTSVSQEYTKEEFNYHQSHWQCVYQTISVKSYKHEHKEAQRDVSGWQRNKGHCGQRRRVEDRRRDERGVVKRSEIYWE